MAQYVARIRLQPYAAYVCMQAPELTKLLQQMAVLATDNLYKHMHVTPSDCTQSMIGYEF